MLKTPKFQSMAHQHGRDYLWPLLKIEVHDLPPVGGVFDLFSSSAPWPSSMIVDLGLCSHSSTLQPVSLILRSRLHVCPENKLTTHTNGFINQKRLFKKVMTFRRRWKYYYCQEIAKNSQFSRIFSFRLSFWPWWVLLIVVIQRFLSTYSENYRKLRPKLARNFIKF